MTFANGATDMMNSALGKDLGSVVAKQFGLTSDQSKGGIGAILGLAKEKLTSNDFDKIAAAVPGADKYVAKAKKMGLLDKPLENKDGLNAALAKAGIPKEKSGDFLTTVTQMISNVGGDEVKKLMASVVG
ncbi:MAG TPA: DUF2780 domain-containing protein [Candidatus Polarisedimenticolaceae bacterium]|nr:DUF2780 domain-containing protein [Candidatus Polarisedimenticolaceae bacterium]